MFTHDLAIYCGNQFSTAFQWTENGTAMDLTGWSAKSTIKNSYIFYTLTSDGGQISLGANGEIVIFLSAEVTNGMVPGVYQWDLLLRDNFEKVRPPIVSGTVNVIQGVTRAIPW